jgi:hypothetical protein
MMAVYPLQDAEAWGFTAACESVKLTPSLANQIGPYVGPPFILGRITYGLRSQVDDALGDPVFRLTGPMGKLLDRATIPITRFEIHLGIDTGWI